MSASRQPSRVELKEAPQVNARFEEAIQALVRPVRIRYIPRPPKRPG